MTAYDDSNIFAKIVRGEIPCDKVFENEHAIAFRDISPQASVHVLVIPKGAYVSSSDFFADAPPQAIAGFFAAVGQTVQMLGLDEGGYRLIANSGADARQEVAHFHVHILGGNDLGPMLAA